MLLLVFACACASDASNTAPPAISEAMRANFSTVGIRSVPPHRRDAIETPPEKGQAIIEGVLTGAIEGLTLGGRSGGDAVTLAIGLVVAPIGAVAGGIKGAKEGADGDALRDMLAGIEAGITSARGDPTIADRVFSRLATEAPGAYRRLAPLKAPDRKRGHDGQTLAGVGTLLEISDVKIVLDDVAGDAQDPNMSLYIETQARLTNLGDGSVYYDEVRRWGVYERHQLSEWAADGGRLIREELDSTRDTLAGKIAEDLFLIYHDPRAKTSKSGPIRTGRERRAAFPSLPPRSRLIWGFAPVQPQVGTTPVTVDSLRPTFAWNPFPGEIELPRVGGEDPRVSVPFVPVDLNRVSNVRYELQIRHQGDLVYKRRGIIEPRHILDVGLEPGTVYRWALRAWFDIDGNRRVSEWSQMLYREQDETVQTAGWRGFFFKTPEN